MIIRMTYVSDEDLEGLVSQVWLKLEDEDLPSPRSLTVIEEAPGGPVVELAFDCELTGAKILAAFGERHRGSVGSERRAAGTGDGVGALGRLRTAGVDDEGRGALLA
jgi:hypothetical protein